MLDEPAGVDPDDVTDLVDLYVRRSLARRSDPGCIILHDLQSDYVRARTPDLAAVHGRLLDAYAKHCPNGWPTGPDDGYFFQFVPYHLDEAGRQQVLSALLLNYRWLDAKLRATNVINLIADYDRLPDNDETRLVQRAYSSPALDSPAINHSSEPSFTPGSSLSNRAASSRSSRTHAKPLVHGSAHWSPL